MSNCRDGITTNGKEEKKMRQLGNSKHKDMSAYLQDFGFGGFVGYGGGVPCGLVDDEELKMYDG